LKGVNDVMKIVLAARNVLPFHSFCGTGRYVHGLAKHLVELGATVDIIAPPEREGRAVQDSANGINYHFISPMVKGSRFFGFYRSYHLHNFHAAKFVSKMDFDILHIFEINAFPYLFRRNRKPVVASPFHRGTEPWKEESLSARFSELPIDFPLSYTLEHADAVASEGPTQTKKLIEKYGIPPKKVFEIPDGVDLNLINEYTENPAFSRRDVGLSDDDFVLISVGRTDPMKGVHNIIDAFAILVEELPNAHLVLVGEGSEDDKIHQRIRKLDLEERVRHVKNVSDRELFSYYSVSDVFVTGTLYEGLPQVILEAMACGLPIVATDTGENSQVVKEGVNGFLVPPKEPHAMAEAIIRLHDTEKRRKMGADSRRMIREYDWEFSAEKALKAYEKLVA